MVYDLLGHRNPSFILPSCHLVILSSCLDVLEPAPPILGLAAKQAEKRLLDRGGDWAALARADREAVDRTNGRDLGGGAGEEQLVGQVERLARQVLLAYLVAQAARQRDDRVAGDAWQQRRGERRGENHTVADHKQVLARAFAQVAAHVERDALGVAVTYSLHHDQLR